MISTTELYTLPAWFSNNGQDTDVVVSTRIRLARNLADHQFPVRASLLEKQKLFEEVLRSVRSLRCFDGYESINFASLEKLDQQILAEKRAVSPDMLRLDGDRGVVSDAQYKTCVLVNEEDHLRIQVMDAGYQPKSIWKTIDKLDTELGKKLNFAYEEQRGFLTCCPTNAGTGMRVSFLLHLPGLVLTKTIDQVLQGASQMGVSTRGSFGEHSEVLGNFFQLSNQTTMGVDEREVLESMISVIDRVIQFERTARERILTEARAELSDKVFRAYGMLRYAVTLSLGEMLNLTSALRTGKECGILDTISINELNKTMILCMPAHIQLREGKAMEMEMVGIKRAEIMREFVVGVQV